MCVVLLEMAIPCHFLCFSDIMSTWMDSPVFYVFPIFHVFTLPSSCVSPRLGVDPPNSGTDFLLVPYTCK